MGAVFVSFPMSASDETTLRKNFKIMQIDSCEYHGNQPYGGHIGLKSSLEISNKVFKNEEEAEEYLSGHTNKEGAAVAVKVGNFNKLFPSTAVEKKEQAKLISLKETFENWDTNLIANVKNAKSTQRGCKKCGSKVSVKYVKSTSCPVCGDHNFIKTEKDDKAFQALRVKILAQDKMVKEMAKKYEEKNKDNFWYIGAECPS